jgi:hypothetical protein
MKERMARIAVEDLIREFGFVVTGYMDPICVGHIDTKVFQVEMWQNFIATRRTDATAWMAQVERLSELHPSWHRRDIGSLLDLCEFWEMRTD